MPETAPRRGGFMSNRIKTDSNDISKKIMVFKEDQTLNMTPAGYDMIFSNYLTECGSKFKEVRTSKLRCSQDKMGDIMNLSQSEVSRLERGQRKMNIIHLFTLKSIYPDFDLNDLVGDCSSIDFLIGAKDTGKKR